MADFLDVLEQEAIYVLREAAGQFKRPVVLFSGGKDSLCLLHLAKKAFLPASFPFPILHIDTGHSFPETLVFRDKIVAQLKARLLVGKVEESIRMGRASDETGHYPSRNRIQTITLLDTLLAGGFDAAIGGARRDEEKARSKERFFSLREKSGEWNPYQQRVEPWDLYNGHLLENQTMRVFPLNNWTELDIWRYIKRENLEVPSLYFSHLRMCVKRADQIWLPMSQFIRPPETDIIVECKVRFRTVGDMTCTSPCLSTASTVDEIIDEITHATESERGSRADDRTSLNAMEERKRGGYF